MSSKLQTVGLLIGRLPLGVRLMGGGLILYLLTFPALGICGPSSPIGGLFLLGSVGIFALGALLSMLWIVIRVIQWLQPRF